MYDDLQTVIVWSHQYAIVKRLAAVHLIAIVPDHCDQADPSVAPYN